MHGPGTIVLKQDHRSAPPVTLTGVWYAPEAAHHLLLVTALTHRGFQCEITNRTKIWDKMFGNTGFHFVTKHFASLVLVIPGHSRKQSPLPAG